MLSARTSKRLDGIETCKRVMSARQRKTLIVCTSCHDKIHAGKLESRLAA